MAEVTVSTYLFQCPNCGAWELQTEARLDECTKCGTKMTLVKERSWSYDDTQMQASVAASRVVPAVTEPTTYVNTTPYVASGIVCAVLIAVFLFLAKRMFLKPKTRK